jgi:hypothetical protein
MIPQTQDTAPLQPDQELQDLQDLDEAYKRAVERAITRIPVKNGVVSIDSIWVETSLPFEVLHRVLKVEGLVLPGNVERVNTKSNVRARASLPSAPSGGSTRTAKRRKRRKAKAKSKAKAGD